MDLRTVSLLRCTFLSVIGVLLICIYVVLHLKPADPYPQFQTYLSFITKNDKSKGNISISKDHGHGVFPINKSMDKTQDRWISEVKTDIVTDKKYKPMNKNTHNISSNHYQTSLHSHFTQKKMYIPKKDQVTSKLECNVPVNCSNDSNPAFKMDFNDVTIDGIIVEHPDITSGGSWHPTGCLSKPLALVIPFRDREQHLNILLRNLFKFLKIQQRAFHVYVIEQAGDTLFNRASLLNIGFLEAMKRSNYSCFIFHDVDMVPVRLCNVYDCPQSGARHMAVSINRNPTEIYYENFMGGVMALSTWAIRNINGFTNIMFGWGGEDDDASARLQNANITVERFDSDIANYSMINHRRDKTNPRAFRGLDLCKQTSLHYKLDGLHNVEYKILSSVRDKLFTNITVDLEGPKTREEAFSYFDEKRYIYGKQMNISNIL